MNIKSLKLGEYTIKMPIIQGGMGIGVSRSNLAAAVTNAGGIGVISAAQIGYDNDDFNTNPLKANLRALSEQIKIAKQKCNNGIIGLNVMVAMTHYDEYIKEAIKSGIDLIISGAGLPLKLPKLVEGSKVKIAPIVSSLKAAKTILKMWDRKYNSTADMVVIEGPKAGGHLGFKPDELESVNLDEIVKDVIEEVKVYETKYNKNIPVIVGGGIYDGKDLKHYLDLGASGVQMATRFVPTIECDADEKYKQAYINANEEDVVIVQSPVGMPGRAIKNKFIDKIKTKQKITKCYQCLHHCDPKTTPYCITEALINAVQGNVDEGLLFCGSNVTKTKEIVSVSEVFRQIQEEYAK